MDLLDFKSNARNYAYQLRKNFPEDESPIAHYVCDDEIVVISTKKLYIFYRYNSFVDYFGDKLSLIDIDNIDLEKATCILTLQKRKFDLTFQEKKDLKYLLKYIEKYK